MSYVNIQYPNMIDGTPITPMWTALVDSVHDQNFYLKDEYVFPLVTKPVTMTGSASTDVASADIYLGDISVNTGQRGGYGGTKIAAIIPVNTVLTFLLPPQPPGLVKLTVLAYNTLGEEVARSSIAFLFTNYATLLWPFYREMVRDGTLIAKLLSPWLSEGVIGLPEIAANFLQYSKIPLNEWPSIESARSVCRMAIQALYANDITLQALKDYITAYFGTLPYVEGPFGWVLGGTDYRASYTLSATGSVSVGTDVLAMTGYSQAFNSPLASSTLVASAGTVSLATTAPLYMGCFPLFEIDVLDWTFPDGSWIGIAPYAFDSSADAWGNYDPPAGTYTTIVCTTTQSSGNQWVPAPGDIYTTAQRIVTAFNTTFGGTLAYNLVASLIGYPGRIGVYGTDPMNGNTSNFWAQYIISKGGPDPNLTMVKITKTRLLDWAPQDTVVVDTLSNGPITDYGALFLGTAPASANRHILEGTITQTGVDRPYGSDMSVVRISDLWRPESYKTTQTFTASSILLDTDGSISGTPGDFYFLLTYPVQEIVSYSLNGVTPVYVPPYCLDLGPTTPSATATYTVTYYRRPDTEARYAVDQVSPAFYSPNVFVEPGYYWVNPSSVVLCSGDLSLFSSGGLTLSATGLSAIDGVWGRTKTSPLLQDVACYDTSILVQSGVFSVGDTIAVGRDQLQVTAIQLKQYQGDQLTLSGGLLEGHYAGESVYVPDAFQAHSLSTGTLDLFAPAASGIYLPPNKRIVPDIVDSRFRDTYRNVSLWQSDDGISWVASASLATYPYVIRPALLDPMGGSFALGLDYPGWSLSTGAGSYYTITTLSGPANSPSGQFPSGALRISGTSSSSYGVERHFPQGLALESPFLSFWVRGIAGAGSAHADFSTRIPMALEAPYALEYSIPFSYQSSGSGWTQVNLDLSTIPATSIPQLRTLRFWCSSGSGFDVSSIVSGRFYRYFRVKLDVYDSKSREDYILSRLGIRAVTDPRHPVWPILTL